MVLLSLQSEVQIQSTRHVCMRVVTMRHDTIVVIAFCMIVLQDILIRQTVLTRHQAKLLRIVRTRAHLPEAHPHHRGYLLLSAISPLQRSPGSSVPWYSSSEGSSDYEDACSAYSDGYDDIDMQQDYDEDRYEKDSDYAEGVDDAMDDAYYEYGEEY